MEKVMLFVILIILIAFSGCVQQKNTGMFSTSEIDKENNLQYNNTSNITEEIEEEVSCDQIACAKQNKTECEATTKITYNYYCKENSFKQKECIADIMKDEQSIDCGYEELDKIHNLEESITKDSKEIIIFSAVKKDSYNWKGGSGTSYTEFAEDNKTFLFLDVEIKNIGDSSMYACPYLNLTIKDNQKNSYDTSITYSSDNEFECTTLTPNTKKRGLVYAEIPKSASGLIAVYEFWNMDTTYGYWNLSKIKTETNTKIKCSYNEIVQNNKCVKCGGENQPCCEDSCDYGKGCFNNICHSCGGENENACPSKGCDYGYEIINGNCIKKCGIYEIRQNGECIECGDNTQIPCKDGCKYNRELKNGICIEKCGFLEIRESNLCVECGSSDQPCCEGNECFLGSCVDNICRNCGKAYQNCCKDNTCDQSGYVCSSGNTCLPCGTYTNSCCSNSYCESSILACDKDNICQLCGTLTNICCEGNECYIGSCVDGICQ